MLQVLPPTTTLATASDHLTPEHLATEIKADIARFERTAREAAFIALRIGLRLIWVRDNTPRGSLAGFIRDHFDGIHSERTLQRYISVSERFAIDAGLVEKRTLKLTDAAKVSPILDAQLDLFTDPQAKFDGAMKKLVTWVGDRGLSDLYKETQSYPRRNTAGQIVAGKGKPLTEDELTARANDEIQNILRDLDAWLEIGHHTRLPKPTRDQTAALLQTAAKKIHKVA